MLKSDKKAPEHLIQYRTLTLLKLAKLSVSVSRVTYEQPKVNCTLGYLSLYSGRTEDFIREVI